jgi:hypothetical protein
MLRRSIVLIENLYRDSPRAPEERNIFYVISILWLGFAFL